MRRNLVRAAAGLITVAVLTAGFYLPSLAMFLLDRSVSEQIATEYLQIRSAEREPLNICYMLRMAYVTDKQTALSKGKYLTPESAFDRAKTALEPLEQLSFLGLEWDNCTLQDYTIMFRISSEDLSKRMILWSLNVTSDKGAVMRIAIEDRTGTVLGFSYSDPQHPIYTTQIPPAESQILGQELIDLFTEYWGVTVSNTTVVSGSGGYLLTVTDQSSNLSVEIPWSLDQTGIRMNSNG